MGAWQERPERQRAAILHGISLGVAFALLLWIDRHQWFSGDEWNLLLRRGVLGHHELGLLDPHNEHWVTFLTLIYRGLFSVFGVRTYLPYLLVLVVAHLAVAHLLWRLMLRCRVDPLVATGAATAFMVLGAGWENLVTAFQITFTIAIGIGLLALLVLPLAGPLQRRDAWVSGLLVLALPFSGVSLTMAFVVTFTTFLRRGWRAAVAVVAAPAIVYALWYLGWGRHATAVEQEPFGVALQKAPEFVWRGLVAPVEAFTGMTGAGPALLVVLTIWVVWTCRPATEPWPPVLAMFVAAPVFLALIDLRRSSLGIDAAAAPRYGYEVVVFVLPAAALAASALVARTPLRVPLVVVATGVLCVVGFSDLNDAARTYAAFKQAERRELTIAAALPPEGGTMLPGAVQSLFGSDVTIAELRTLQRDGQLPGNVRVHQSDLLFVSGLLQTTVGSGVLPGLRGKARVEGSEGADVTSAADDPCVTVTPRSDGPAVLLSFAEPGRVRVTTRSAGALTTLLQPPTTDPALRGPARSWPIDAGAPQTVSSTATALWLRLSVPAEGPTRICRVAAAPA